MKELLYSPGLTETVPIRICEERGQHALIIFQRRWPNDGHMSGRLVLAGNSSLCKWNELARWQAEIDVDMTFAYGRHIAADIRILIEGDTIDPPPKSYEISFCRRGSFNYTHVWI